MSQDLRTLELFAEANPVPDEQTIEANRIEAAAYLATLQQRSSDVVQLDERKEVKESRKRNWMIAAAAAVVVVLGAVVFILTQTSEEPPVATQPPVTTQPPATTQPPVGAGPIEGTWDTGTVGAIFEADTYQFVIDGVVVDSGTYRTAEPRQIFLLSDADSQGCEVNSDGSWEYWMVEDGMTLTGLEEGCLFRSWMVSGPLEFAPTDSLDITSEEFEVTGSWENQTGTLTLENGNYAFVVDGETVDRGTYEVPPSPYRIALSPESTDENCGPVEYQFALQQDDGVLFMDGDDACAARSPFLISDLQPIESP